MSLGVSVCCFQETAFVTWWEQKLLQQKQSKYDNHHEVENNTACVFKQVETVGDKYMTVSGLPEPCTHHAKSICHLALDMMEIAGQVKVDDESVQVG